MDTEFEWFNHCEVNLIDHTLSDDAVCFAAWTSTKGDEADHTARTGLINRLMKDRHGSPFEHMWIQFQVTAPIFVWREHHRHRMACMTGDSAVTLCDPKGTGLRSRTIAQIWENWHLGVLDRMPGGEDFKTRRRLLPSSRNIYVRTYDEETMLPQPGRVLDVVQTGVKPIVLLETRSGRSIRCTADHQVLTVDGWKRVFELTDRDFVLRAGKRAIRDTPPIPPMLRRGIGVWTSGLREEMIGEIDTCYLCEEKFVRAELVLDHVIPVALDLPRALDRNNLKPACVPCHRIKTDGEQIYAERMGSRSAAVPDRVSHVTSLGIEEMTYDLVVDEPWHNYLANGLVVHNSYNEESARYRTMRPRFYVPPRHRMMVQVEGTKAMDYVMTTASPKQYETLNGILKHQSRTAYLAYEQLLDVGIVREVARMHLPVNLMSTCIVSMNARALMNFLSLRVKSELSAAPTNPQWEINEVALQYEKTFKSLAPITHAAFVANGRVAP